jgi:hypothetical protein
MDLGSKTNVREHHRGNKNGQSRAIQLNGIVSNVANLFTTKKKVLSIMTRFNHTWKVHN